MVMWRRNCCCHVASLFNWQKYLFPLHNNSSLYVIWLEVAEMCNHKAIHAYYYRLTSAPVYWREWRRPQRCTVLARAETRSGKGQEVEWGGFLSAAAVITSSGQDQDTSWWPIYHLSLAQLWRGSPKCCVHVPVFRIIVIISSTAATNCLQSLH